MRVELNRTVAVLTFISQKLLLYAFWFERQCLNLIFEWLSGVQLTDYGKIRGWRC